MWTLRMGYEKKYHKKSCMVTLTYDEEYLPQGGTLVKKDLQLFLKRFRKNLGLDKVRYFAAGEYGDDKSRPHYHLIMYGVDEECSDFYDKVWNPKHQGWDCKSYSWPFGIVSIDPATEASIAYVAGYVTKKVKDKKDWYKERGVLPEFVLMSRKPGIGEQYMRDHFDKLKRDGFIKKRGLHYSLPRYYEDKMYTTEEEKEIRHRLKLKENWRLDAQMRDYCRKYNLNFIQYAQDVLAQRDKNIKAKMALKKKGELNE